MRKPYHLKLQRTEQQKFRSACETLGIEIGSYISTNTLHSSYDDYFVSLSKYELLYIRLTCQIISIVNTDDFKNKQHEATTDQSRSPA